MKEALLRKSTTPPTCANPDTDRTHSPVAAIISPEERSQMIAVLGLHALQDERKAADWATDNSKEFCFYMGNGRRESRTRNLRGTIFYPVFITLFLPDPVLLFYCGFFSCFSLRDALTFAVRGVTRSARRALGVKTVGSLVSELSLPGAQGYRAGSVKSGSVGVEMAAKW